VQAILCQPWQGIDTRSPQLAVPHLKQRAIAKTASFSFNGAALCGQHQSKCNTTVQCLSGLKPDASTSQRDSRPLAQEQQ
jgi:hypothetical protein